MCSVGLIIEVACFPVPTEILFYLSKPNAVGCTLALWSRSTTVFCSSCLFWHRLTKAENLHFKESTKANGGHRLPPGRQWKKFPELGLLSMEEPDGTTSCLGDRRKVSHKMGWYVVCRFVVGAKWSSICAWDAVSGCNTVAAQYIFVCSINTQCTLAVSAQRPSSGKRISLGGHEVAF